MFLIDFSHIFGGDVEKGKSRVCLALGDQAFMVAAEMGQDNAVLVLLAELAHLPKGNGSDGGRSHVDG